MLAAWDVSWRRDSKVLQKAENFMPCLVDFGMKNAVLSAPQRCNAQRSDAQRNFFTLQFIPPFLQRHRCGALLCFSASPVITFYIAHIAFLPLLPFFLSPQWLTVQNNKKFWETNFYPARVLGGIALAL